MLHGHVGLKRLEQAPNLNIQYLPDSQECLSFPDISLAFSLSQTHKPIPMPMHGDGPTLGPSAQVHTCQHGNELRNRLKQAWLKPGADIPDLLLLVGNDAQTYDSDSSCDLDFDLLTHFCFPALAQSRDKA
ncbi:hypothetical protein LZP73_19045 [Shewanella sp. AS16]|uniref:hypothetical protein n=1 Tax=Shewanella sp. AS16 TaxID=2907625 RepID=UPI001F43624E|nr:hypothetical protein [Shewanella sp. AS16]MCE9688270.1 hypothetical protein [Shewanella sp. AS16]